MKFKALGCICIIEIAGTIGAVMKNPAAAGICLTGTCFLTGYTAYLEMRRMQIKICPECKCEIQKSYRICPECGHSMVKKCPKCDSVIEGSPKFCPECGERL